MSRLFVGKGDASNGPDMDKLYMKEATKAFHPSARSAVATRATSVAGFCEVIAEFCVVLIESVVATEMHRQ